MELNSVSNHWYPPQFNLMQQYAEMHPSEKNTFRTFYIRRNHSLNKSEIIGLSNWVIGEIPPNIRIAHPMFIQKVRSGNFY